MLRGLLLRSVAMGAAGVLVLAAWSGPEGERPWSVQLHLHGSFSEGAGSIDSHGHEASDLGLDVLWWSDHDWRIASYRHCASFSFDSATERVDHREAWTTAAEPAGRGGHKRTASVPWASTVADDPFEGTGCLRVEPVRRATGSAFGGPTERADGSEGFLVELLSPRRRFRRPLASGVTLELAVFPEQVDGEGRPLIEIELSEHPAGEGLEFETWTLEYVLTREPGLARREGARYVIPVACRAGEWNELELRVSEDARAGFGELLGEDNSLARISVGVEAQPDASPAARFDDLRILQELAGSAALAKQRALIDGMTGRRPQLRQLQGLEVSYLNPHLNVYGLEPRLLDYDALAAELELEPEGDAFGAAVARHTVEEAHAAGALVSFNHFFGADMVRDVAQRKMAEPDRTRDEVLEELLAHRLYDADLLEVGYRDRGQHDLDDHLWVWDQLALSGLFPVGVGVSDSHGGPDHRWRGGGNNFVSWILAPEPTRAALLEGLRRGRVFFGDIEHFDGRLDLVTDRGHRMGHVVETERSSVRVTLEAEGLDEGDVVRWMVAGAPREHGPWPSIEVQLSAVPTPVRVEIHDRRGRAVALSNPIVFVRPAPEDGARGPRVARESR